jgi:hypothetical protein
VIATTASREWTLYSSEMGLSTCRMWSLAVLAGRFCAPTSRDDADNQNRHSPIR